MKKSIEMLGKMAKQAQGMMKDNIKTANDAIDNLESEEDKKFMRDLMKKAMSGKMSTKEIIDQINGRKV